MASYDGAIPPGSAGTIKATVRTEGFRGVTERAITVESDDPDLPRVAVFVRVNAAVGVSLLPAPSLRLGRGGRGAPSEDVLLVRREPGVTETLQVEGVEATAPWLRVSAREAGEAEPPVPGRPPVQAGDWVLQVALGEDAPSGASVQTVRFRTGLPVEPKVEIPVRVTVPYPVNLSVPNLVLQPAPDGWEGTVLGTIRADLDPAALDLRVDPPYQASMEPAGSDRAFRLRVRAPADAAPGRVVFRFGPQETVLAVAPAPAPRP